MRKIRSYPIDYNLPFAQVTMPNLATILEINGTNLIVQENGELSERVRHFAIVSDGGQVPPRTHYVGMIETPVGKNKFVFEVDA